MEWARASNDASREIAGTLHPDPDERYGFFCECGCRQRLELRLKDFDELRAAGTPVLRDGHFVPVDGVPTGRPKLSV